MSSQHAFIPLLMLMVLQIPVRTDRAQYYVHRVTLAGSTEGATDKALRKACAPIEEGKIYTAANLDRAISAINKLGVFRKLTRADCTVTRPTRNPGTVDILIRLRPKAPAGKAVKPE